MNECSSAKPFLLFLSDLMASSVMSSQWESERDSRQGQWADSCNVNQSNYELGYTMYTNQRSDLGFDDQTKVRIRLCWPIRGQNQHIWTNQRSLLCFDDHSDIRIRQWWPIRGQNQAMLTNQRRVFTWEMELSVMRTHSSRSIRSSLWQDRARAWDTTYDQAYNV